ncbi:MAG: OmpA family protein [Hyphomicrobium sp.]|nr:OmpA family protein [Hyphomicrobium sp.]
MPHDNRHVAFLLFAVATAIAPLPARAEKDVSPIILAQDTAPAASEEKKDEKKSKAQEREQRREEKSKQRQERREQDPQGQQNQNQQRIEQQKEKQQERAQQRQQEMERRRQDREQQQKQRQEQIENQRQQRDAERAKQQQENELRQQERARQDQERDQKRQQREAERAKQQQENELRQQERARQDQERDQTRQQREAERAKQQQENELRQQERVRQDQERDQKRQEQEAERAKKQEEKERRQQDRVLEDQLRGQQRQEQRARDDRTGPDDARPARNGDRRRDNIEAQRDGDRDRHRVRRQQIRESYRQAPAQQRSFDDLKRKRRERSIADGKLRVIEEPDRRVIVKQDNRTFIRHDESERFRRIAPDARTIRRADGTSTTFMTRRGGVRIYDVTDRHGRLLYRYRRYPSGREVVLIDNRRYYRRDSNRTRDVLIGAGIGLFIGSAIALSAPEVRIPRDRYIVDYGRASDDDLYEALTAPPIERLERGYSLEEIRYSPHLRDRMRRIDLDTVTFDFGSWEVGPDQGRALDRLADGINRVLARNPDEIFMIEGHTDAVGSQEDNLTLSDRRAQSVAEILTTEYGVAPENLVTQGYGEEQLKIPTDGPERANRRIAVRRIGPLLSGRFDDDRYSGGGDDRFDDDPGFDDGRFEDRR